MTDILTKRACVSDCVVPSCSTINCSSGETCILSSQTCSACPSVSCVSLNLDPTEVSNDELPKAAIAGISVASLVLLGCLCLLGWKLYKRRQVIREISEKSIPQYSLQDATHEEEYAGPSGQSARFPSLASIQIGLGPGMLSSAAPMSRTPSPLPSPGDHFFSADDLLRMSYAESVNTIDSARHSDKGAAIMQANNPIVGVRAKAAVMQYSKGQATSDVGEDEKCGLSRHGTLQRARSGVLQTQQVSQSVWEEESVTNSPIERELISPDRFAFSLAASETRSERSLRQRASQTTPTKSRTSASMLTRADTDHSQLVDSAASDHQVASKLFSSSIRKDTSSNDSETYDDWFDPALVNER